VADDHRIVREGLRVLLEAEKGIAIVGETGDGLKVPDLVQKLNPHVLIVDLMMPGLNGLEVTRQVAKRSPTTRIIILSMHANEAYVMEALRNGASGYVLKDSGMEELVRAIFEVNAGRHYLGSPLSERAIELYSEKAVEAELDVYETLTRREREGLHLAAESKTNRKIAARLSISQRTVETHKANLMRKLNLHSQTELIRFALQRGIIPLDS